MNDEVLSTALKIKETAGTLRSLSLKSSCSIDFTSNDYLNLSTHPDVIGAAVKAVQEYGTGATGSRLLSGNSQAFLDLEDDIARLKGQEAALVFNSGFQANLSILGVILSSQHDTRPVTVFADKLNHASMHQGCHLAGVRQHRYNHLDYNHLETLVKKYAKPGHRHFILTESVFGMDGDCADLRTICDLAETVEAQVYVDEAHATGVFGEHGSGLTRPFADRIYAVMGTFSKALGGFGAYVAGSQALKDYLINFAPGFIYSTALPPATIAANHQALKLLPTLTQARHHMLNISTILRDKLKASGYNIGQSTTHIFPIIIPDINHASRIHTQLIRHGIQTSLIRPPTVPPNTTRLRIALQAEHTLNEIEKFMDILTQSL